jgi:hypothetical protein
MRGRGGFWVVNYKAMIKMLTLIFLAVYSLGMKPIENSFINEDCYKLLEAAKRDFPFGPDWREKYLIAIECFEENGDYDKAINIFYNSCRLSSEIQDVWLKKYVELINKKYAPEEIRSQLKQVNVKVERDEFFAHIITKPNLEKITWENFVWSEYFFLNFNLFEKSFSIVSTAKSNDEDNLVFKNYLLNKISKSDLEEYFQKRWLESSLYKALAN